MNEMEKHLTFVAALHIANSALGILAGGLVFILVALPGLLSGDPTAMAVTPLVGGVVAAFLYAISLPGLVGGVGLWKRRKWSRPLLLVVSTFNLLNVPIGTLIAVYSFWVLFHEETEDLLEPATRQSPTSTARAA